MQGAHHLAGGVKVRCEIVHAKQGKRGKQANLTRAMDMSVFLFFIWRGFVSQKNNDIRRAMEKSMLITFC